MENWNAFSVIEQTSFTGEGNKFWQFIGMGFSKVVEKSVKAPGNDDTQQEIINVTLNCIPLTGSIQLRLVDKEKHKDPEYLKLQKLYYEVWGFYQNQKKQLNWYRIGFAHTNKDQSIRVDLNAIPGNLKFQLKETEKKIKETQSPETEPETQEQPSDGIPF